MSVHEPNSRHLRETSVICFNIEKADVWALQMLVNTDFEGIIFEKACCKWFHRFKNSAFNVDDLQFTMEYAGGGLTKNEMGGSLYENSLQIQKKLTCKLGATQQAGSKCLKIIGMLQNNGDCVMY